MLRSCPLSSEEGDPVRMPPVLWLYVFLTVAVLLALADLRAPYPGVATGCRLGYVYDGDTIEMVCQGQKSTARLLGFDAPETKSPRCAAEAEWGHRATERLRGLAKQPQIELFRHGFDKYGRELVLMRVGGADVAQIMINENLGVAYDGGKRRGWCAG